MALCLLVTDAAGSEIEPALRDLEHDTSSPSALSDRMFIEAILYRTRT